MKKKLISGLSFAFLFISSTLLFAENTDTVISKIKKNYTLIESASKIFGVNPNYLAAIIYVERTENFTWEDEAADELLAIVGLNSSIGLCQIKIKTAYFIEIQLNDTTSSFYPGDKYKGILSVSKSPFEIIERLENDSLSILYAAAYLRIIQSYWNKAGYSIDDKPGIIGSLYQLGLFKADGSPRQPHFNPKANEFGNTVIESLYLFGYLNRENRFEISY